jgi:hypothetical protein
MFLLLIQTIKIGRGNEIQAVTQLVARHSILGAVGARTLPAPGYLVHALVAEAVGLWPHTFTHANISLLEVTEIEITKCHSP